MIRLPSEVAVMASAEKLADNSLSLTPIPGSPLDELSRLCKPLDISEGAKKVVDNSEPVACNYDVVKASQYADQSGCCPHDETMQQYVDATAKIVENNLNLARNVVNPMVKAVVEQATQYADIKGRSANSPMNIVPCYLPAPYNNPILAEIVSRYGETYNNDMRLSIAFPPMAAGVIREKAMTGITRLDEDIEAWLSNCSDDMIEGIYNAAFSEQGASTLSEVFGDPMNRAGAALLVFLLARRFMDDIPDGVNAPLNVYKEYVSSLMAQAGRQVVYVIQTRANNDRTNALVIRAPYRSGTADTARGDIIVNPDVYRRWLKEGGTPEALFGAIHVGKNALVYQDLLENKDNYIGVWQRATNILKTKAGFERFNLFLEGMRQALLTQLASLPDDIRQCDDAGYKQCIGEHLQRVKEGGVDEPWAIGRKLVCRVFFSGTDAETVLWAIATQCKEHPDMDVREAALLATIEIVAKWVAAQFDVEKVKITNLPSQMAA